MSAPTTNVEKQSKRHRPALWGIGAVVLAAAIGFGIYLAILAAKGNTPGEAETQTSFFEPDVVQSMEG